MQGVFARLIVKIGVGKERYKDEPHAHDNEAPRDKARGVIARLPGDSTTALTIERFSCQARREGASVKTVLSGKGSLEGRREHLCRYIMKKLVAAAPAGMPPSCCHKPSKNHFSGDFCTKRT